jgi:hypothetical protein
VELGTGDQAGRGAGRAPGEAPPRLLSLRRPCGLEGHAGGGATATAGVITEVTTSN